MLILSEINAYVWIWVRVLLNTAMELQALWKLGKGVDN
jgi:hypothetical protein